MAKIQWNTNSPYGKAEEARIIRHRKAPRPDGLDNSIALVQLPDESDLQYHVFLAWVGLGPERSFARVASAFRADGITEELTKKVALKNDWHNRLETWRIERAQNIANELRETQIVNVNATIRQYDAIIADCQKRIDQSRTEEHPGGNPVWAKLMLEAISAKRQFLALDQVPPPMEIKVSHEHVFELQAKALATELVNMRDTDPRAYEIAREKAKQKGYLDGPTMPSIEDGLVDQEPNEETKE